jgi:uncharacterized membrane protein YeaQ/YmgE (transglycosylase-associated protein family)
MLKTLLIFAVGMIISYLIYHFFAHNGGLISKLIYGIPAAISWFIVINALIKRFEDYHFYNSLVQLSLIISIIGAILTYEFFDKITYGGTANDLHAKLEKTSAKSFAKITEIEYYPAFTVKRKDMPEHWEIKYEFRDSLNQVFKGIFNTRDTTNLRVSDTLTIKYLKENPEISERVK